MNDFSRKMFLMLHSINWTNFIVWLPLLLEILGNTCITIVCLPVCDVMKLKINLIFLINRFWYMTKMSRQKLNYLENEKSFWGEIKSIFIFLKGLSVQKLFQTWECAFNRFINKVINFTSQQLSKDIKTNHKIEM